MILKIKIFDYEHEKDLEDAVNDYIKNKNNVIDIKYQTSHFSHSGEQIYSFSAMIIFQDFEQK